MFIEHMKQSLLVISFIILLPFCLSAGRLPINADLIGTWKIIDISYVKPIKIFNKDHADSLLNTSQDYAAKNMGAIIVFKLDSTFTYTTNSTTTTTGRWLLVNSTQYVRLTENSKEIPQYNTRLSMMFDTTSTQQGFNGDIKSFNHQKQNFIYFDGRYQILFKRIK